MKQSIPNIAAIAEAAGTNLSKTVKTTILLTDLSGFAAINEAYGAFLEAPYPARATFDCRKVPRSRWKRLSNLHRIYR